MNMRTGLIITGDSAGAQKAVAELDQGMDHAEKGAQDLSAAVDRVDAATDRLVSDANNASAALERQGASAGKAAAEQRELAQGVAATSSAIGGTAADAQQAASGLNNYAGSTAKAAAEQRLLARGVDIAGKEWERASIALGRTSQMQVEAANSTALTARETDDYARSLAALRASVDPVGTEIAQLNNQLDLAVTAFLRGDMAAEEFEQTLSVLGGRLKVLDQVTVQGGASAGAYRAGMQQLGFQMQDFAVQVAGGTSATRAFAQQFPQAIGAAQLMLGTSSKLGTFLGGPWGIALGVAAAALVPLIAKLWETEDALSDVADQADTTMKRLNSALAQASVISNEATRSLKNMLTAQAEIAQTNAKITQTLADADAAARSFGQGDLAAQLYQQVGALERKKAAAEENLKVAKSELEQARSTSQVAALQAAAQAKLNASVKDGTKATRERSTASRQLASGLSVEQKAYEQAYATADRYIQSLEDEIERIGKTPKQLRELEVARAMEAAATDEQRLAIKRLSEQREFDLGIQELEADRQKSVDWKKQRLDPIQREIALLGLVGPAREIAALALEEEAFKAEAVENKVGDAEAAWEEYYDTQLRLIEGRSYIEEQLYQARLLEQQINALTGAIGRMGGVGNVIGALGSGNPAAALLGMGGFGTLAGGLLAPGSITGMGLGIEGGLNQLGIGKLLGGSSTAALGQALAGAGFGVSIGGSLGGLVGSKSGGQIGGGIGGAAFGPIGAIGGALIGGVVGDLVKSTKRGGVTIGANDNGAGITGGWGNSASRSDTATQLANQAIDMVRQIIEGLGGEMGSFTGSVSMREDNLRYDPTGSGISKTSKGAIDFGQDAEALVAAIIEDAFADGAAQNLSEQIKRLLAGDGDIQARVAKAQSYKAIMDEVAEASDPAGAALAEFAKREREVMDLLDEAGASSEDRAKVEQWLADQRTAIVEQFADKAVEAESRAADQRIELLDAQGRTFEAEMLKRQQTLASLTGDDRTAKEAVFAAQDAMAVRQAEIELMRAQGREQEAITAARELERAAMAPAVAAIHDMIDAANAWTASVARAKAIFAAEQRELIEIARLEGRDGDALRMEREDALRNADPAVRGDMIRKFELQDQATAEAAVIQTMRDRIEILRLQGEEEAAHRLEQELEIRTTEASRVEHVKLRQALEDQAASAAKATQEAEVLAAKQKAIADERYGIETQLLQLQGNTEELRRRQLERTDPENRELLQQYFDAQDAIARQEEAARQMAAAQQAAAAAAEEHARAIEQVKSRLTAAWQRDRSELESMRERFGGLADNLAELRAGLAGDLRADGNGYNAARDAFFSAAGKARLGDADAMQGLGGTADAFLAASKGNASSMLEYQRDVAAVARAYSEAEATARRTVDKADRQIAALDASVENLIDIREKAETVNQLIEELNRLQEAVVVPSVTSSLDTGFTQVAEQLATSTNEAKSSSAAQKSSIDKLVSQSEELVRIIKNNSQGGYFRVAIPDDKVVKVTWSNSLPVKVTNTTADPVPVEEQAA